jgi:hypothetical protein
MGDSISTSLGATSPRRFQIFASDSAASLSLADFKYNHEHFLSKQPAHSIPWITNGTDRR